MRNREVALPRIYGENRRREVTRHSTLEFVHISLLQLTIFAIQGGPARWVVGSAFVYFAVVGVALRANRRSRAAELARMSEKLRLEFEERHERPMLGLLPVGICPDRSLKKYEGDTAWDVGYLDVSDGFHYYGDVHPLHLAWGQIVQVQVVGILRPRMYLKYRLKPQSPLEFISVEVRNGSSPAEQYATLQQIRAQIAMLPDIPVLAAAT